MSGTFAFHNIYTTKNDRQHSIKILNCYKLKNSLAVISVHSKYCISIIPALHKGRRKSIVITVQACA